MVFLENEIVVIELKVEPLEISHLLQLNAYLEDIKQEIKNKVKVRGILIGKEPKDELQNSIKILPFKIKIMILEKEICTKIKICENCILANDKDNSICIYCSSNSFIRKNI